MTPEGKVKFHENSKTYYWDIRSKVVTDAAGREVTRDCSNLDRARVKVRRKYAPAPQPMVTGYCVEDVEVTTARFANAVPEMECEMGTCPQNFDRENSACSGCRHNKVKGRV